MCTNGVNINQFKATIEQIDEAIALTRRWTHRAYHAADDAQQPKTAQTLHKAQCLLDDARALLSEAADTVEQEAAASSGVSVSIV